MKNPGTCETSRKSFLRNAGIATLAGAGAFAARARSVRPNVLFILPEDQGAQMGALGTRGLQTPNMDRIAANGVRFDNAFVGYRVCSASKASIYTGLYPHTNGCRSMCTNHPPGRPPGEEWMKHPLYTRNLIPDKFPQLYEVIRQQDPIGLGGQPPAVELYDLQADPWETTNLAASPKCRAQLNHLLDVLRQWAIDTQDANIRLGTRSTAEG